MDTMSAELLIGQLAALHETYSHEQQFARDYSNAGPLDGAALPVPVGLLQAAVAARDGRTSVELDAVRGLLRLLWQAYDAGGHSVGRSWEARVVEAVMMLVGPPSARTAALLEGDAPGLLRQCEERAYELSRISRDSEEWAVNAARYQAAHERRQSLPPNPAQPPEKGATKRCSF